MDPATTSAAVAAANEVYKIGGYALLFFCVLVFGATAIFIVIFKMYNKLGDRLTAVEDRSNTQAMTVIAQNTASNNAVVEGVTGLKETTTQLVSALRERPCLIDTEPVRQHHHATPLPLPPKRA